MEPEVDDSKAGSKTSKHRRCWWILVLIWLGVIGPVIYFFATENVSRYLAGVTLPLLGIFCSGLWWALLSRLSWRGRAMRTLKVVGIQAVLVGGLMVTTRWEGSLNGGAVPRLVWKWAKKPDELLPRLTGSGAAASEIPESERVSFAQFLGRDRNGVLPDVYLDPDWESHPPEELWRKEVGAGWSGFAVVGGRAITQEQRGPRELVSCYDLLTGDSLWVHENECRFEETMGGDGPRATPTVHEGRVYAMGATGFLDCLNLETGKPYWSRNILEETDQSNIKYGKTCAPLIVDDLVVVTGGSGGPTVLAYHRLTGEPMWTAGDDKASYASPILGTLAGKRQIVSLNHNTVTGHDVETGKVLWSWSWKARMPKSAIPQIVGDNGIFVSASYGMGTALLEISPEGEDLKVEKVWKKFKMKTKFSNVSIRDGFAYGLDEGKMACLELASGELQWRGSTYGYGQNLIVGDHILVQAEQGEVILVEASSEEFREVARLEGLSNKTWNTPTVAGPYLLVRNDLEAVCYKLKLRMR